MVFVLRRIVRNRAIIYLLPTQIFRLLVFVREYMCMRAFVCVYECGCRRVCICECGCEFVLTVHVSACVSMCVYAFVGV